MTEEGATVFSALPGGMKLGVRHQSVSETVEEPVPGDTLCMLKLIYSAADRARRIRGCVHES